jgi:hypothetical protein
MHLSSWLFPKSGEVAQTYGRVLSVTAPRKDELGHPKAPPTKKGAGKPLPTILGSTRFVGSKVVQIMAVFLYEPSILMLDLQQCGCCGWHQVPVPFVPHQCKEVSLLLGHQRQSFFIYKARPMRFFHLNNFASAGTSENKALYQQHVTHPSCRLLAKSDVSDSVQISTWPTGTFSDQ